MKLLNKIPSTTQAGPGHGKHYTRINYIENPVELQAFYSGATILSAKESKEDQNKTKPGTNKTVN